MTTATDIKYITRDPNVCGGKPCIDGYRISVHDVASWHWQGQTPEEMASDFHLSLPQVYAALLYYFDHKEEIDREIAEETADIKARAAADMSPVAQRVRAAIAQRKRQLNE